uniref:DUF5110 domain-containing protein n=1 Tax=Heterorhabditis bacteriophora TaxID=37862 RepID=A0A1I7WU03_HETBA
MLLSLSTSGIPHVGADVGGFFGNPDEQLLVRWYQAGAFQPFFRAHAHLDSNRREPWLFNKTTTDAIREAIKRKYQLLPYWFVLISQFNIDKITNVICRYTLFYEHTITGLPVMRPFWLEFSDDESGYDEDRQWMVINIRLYVYNWTSHNILNNNVRRVYIKGTIIPLRERVRRSSVLMREDPISLYIALNMKGDFANGTIYMDDGESYGYEKGDFAYWGITFKRF